ncbi:Protein of unknown function [Pseudoxanthomonas wuyuanensis]|uniref:Uncharacterized protein n=2 Tax=Pseudoxanthomonas wuyuanensis TaxID=1073196 RepID=A0A286D7Y4_9GAMM|nr:Protein of unknown function [Pseudoxanthomonas wuyuanensis]
MTYRMQRGQSVQPLPALAPNPPLEPEGEDDYVDQRTQDILRRERQHQLAAERHFCHHTDDGQRFLADTQDRTLKEFMDQLTGAHKALLVNDRSPVRNISSWRPAPAMVVGQYELSGLGKLLHACCVRYLTLEERTPDWLCAYIDYVFSPQVTVMLRALQRWAKPIGLWLEAGVPACDGSPDMDAVHALNRFARFVRRASRSWRFINECRKIDRQANDNFSSGRKLLFELFSHCSRLLVLRVDLYFRPWAKALGVSQEADDLIEKFYRRLRDGRIVDDYLGAIYKREDGINRGAHWHWLIVLDGHRRRDAYGLTRRIGEDWMRVAGVNRSSYFNCYVRAPSFKFNGLGLVHVCDTKKLLGLRAALVYLTKRDCVLKLHSGKDQHFRRSKPRHKDKKQRGAPRRSPDSMATLRRVFAGRRDRPLDAITL